MGTSNPVWQGVQRAIPIMLGYATVSFVFGVLALKNRIPAEGAIIMSMIVFAGSGQLIAVGLIGAGAPVLSVVLTTFIVNLRHLLMSAALAPRLGSWGIWRQALFAFQMTDETFAVHATTLKGLPDDPPRSAVFACNMLAHSAWIGGTILGVFCSTLVTDVRPFGLDYALAGMFIALLIPLCRHPELLIAALLAGALSVGFALYGAGRWNVVFATICAATVCYFLPQRRSAPVQHDAAKEHTLQPVPAVEEKR